MPPLESSNAPNPLCRPRTTVHIPRNRSFTPPIADIDHIFRMHAKYLRIILTPRTTSPTMPLRRMAYYMPKSDPPSHNAIAIPGTRLTMSFPEIHHSNLCASLKALLCLEEKDIFAVFLRLS